MALKSSNKVETNVYELEITVDRGLQKGLHEAEKVNSNPRLP